MDKYLLELLKEVNTIIIPGLGALTITNEKTGEIMFMPFLKHDDGKLSSYIAQKEGMEENEAKNLIAKYVRDITTKLDQGDSYDMFQFGSFIKKEDGDIDFRGWTGAQDIAQEEKKEEPSPQPAAEITTKKEIPAEPKEEKKPEKKKTTAKKEESKSEQKQKNQKKETPSAKDNDKPEEKEEIPAPEKVEYKKAEEGVKKKEEIKAKKLNIAEKEELVRNTEKLEKLKTKKEAPKERKKRGAGFWILIVLIVLLGAGGTYVGLNYDKVKQHIPFLAEKEEAEDTPSEMDKMKEMMGVDDEGETETTNDQDGQELGSAEETESTEEQNPTQQEEVSEAVEQARESAPVSKSNAPSSGSYHIIAGAFSSADNAARMADNFRQQGYPVIVGTANGLNMVSIKSFATQQEAEAALPEIRSAAPKAWVFNGNL